MKRNTKIVLAGLVALLIAIQLIPRVRNQSGQPPVNDITTVYQVPENVEVIFKRSCYDCHSNNTSYPWYAHIQPIRYMLDRHVQQGKQDLNFNNFGIYTARKRRNKLRAISSSLTEGTMPLSPYTFIHHSARLNSHDTSAVLSWVKKISDYSN